jgi:predicted regulator of Ras-like GTPase activity (Roadblock/LC7/MglB family)
MADEIRRWSEELAREPNSLVFLLLAEALRAQGQRAVALKIAQRGLDRHPGNMEARALVDRIALELGEEVAVQQAAAALAAASQVEAAAVSAASRLFADLLIDDGQTALLLDDSGYVLGGVYLDGDGRDVGQDVGAQLSGISEEIERSTRHLGLGDWRSLTFETESAVVAMSPAPQQGRGLVVVAASRSTPLGLLRRLLDRCAERASSWLDGSFGPRKARPSGIVASGRA